MVSSVTFVSLLENATQEPGGITEVNQIPRCAVLNAVIVIVIVIDYDHQKVNQSFLFYQISFSYKVHQT